MQMDIMPEQFASHPLFDPLPRSFLGRCSVYLVRVAAKQANAEAALTRAFLSDQAACLAPTTLAVARRRVLRWIVARLAAAAATQEPVNLLNSNQQTSKQTSKPPSQQIAQRADSARSGHGVRLGNIARSDPSELHTCSRTCRGIARTVSSPARARCSCSRRCLAPYRSLVPPPLRAPGRRSPAQ